MKNRENTTSFWLENVDEKARAGRLVTPRGCVDTPLFMPVATQGSVKALDPEDLERVGAGLVPVLRSFRIWEDFIGLWAGMVLFLPTVEDFKDLASNTCEK